MKSILLQRAICPRCGVPQFFPDNLNVPEFVLCINRGFHGPQWQGWNDGGGNRYTGRGLFVAVEACTYMYSTEGNLKTLELHDEECSTPAEVPEPKALSERERARVENLSRALTESVGPQALGRFRDLTDHHIEETLLTGEAIH